MRVSRFLKKAPAASRSPLTPHHRENNDSPFSPPPFHSVNEAAIVETKLLRINNTGKRLRGAIRATTVSSRLRSKEFTKVGGGWGVGRQFRLFVDLGLAATMTRHTRPIREFRITERVDRWRYDAHARSIVGGTQRGSVPTRTRGRSSGSPPATRFIPFLVLFSPPFFRHYVAVDARILFENPVRSRFLARLAASSWVLFVFFPRRGGPWLVWLIPENPIRSHRVFWHSGSICFVLFFLMVRVFVRGRRISLAACSQGRRRSEKENDCFVDTAYVRRYNRGRCGSAIDETPLDDV